MAYATFFDNDISLSTSTSEVFLEQTEMSQEEQAVFRSSMTITRLTGLTLLHLHVHHDIPIGLENGIDMFVRM